MSTQDNDITNSQDDTIEEATTDEEHIAGDETIDSTDDGREELEEGQEEDSVSVSESEEEVDVETRSVDDSALTNTSDSSLTDDDVDPDTLKIIEKVVDRKTSGMKESLQIAKDKLEIDTFLSKNPEFSKYRSKIKTHLRHPAYSRIPVKKIASMVAGDDLVKIGAEKEVAAQKRANATKTVGNMVRQPSQGEPDWARVSKDDFEAQRRKVLGQS